MQDFFSGAARASTPDDIGRAVLAYAEAHWGTDGWETIAENWSLEAVVDTVLREGLQSERDAIRHFMHLARRESRDRGMTGG